MGLLVLMIVLVVVVVVGGYVEPKPQPNNLLPHTLLFMHTQHGTTHQQHRYDRHVHNPDKHHNRSAKSGRRHSADVKVFVDGGGGKVSGFLHHFWRSTGLCPPSPHSSPQPFLLSQDEALNLALVGSAPHQAFTQVRIHWLFDLVNASLEWSVGGEVVMTPVYNFSQLDTLLDHLYHHHLRPGFELMGNPGGIFTDLENDTQVIWWRDLVTQTAARYTGRYGLEWVGSWRWETWNEPDHHDFDNLNFTVQGFLNYYDACRAGLDAVWEGMVLGGPGGSCRDPGFSSMCWALLTHCHQGTSYFPPHRPPRIDFISIHKKGQEDADSILTEEVHTINIIRRSFPRLHHIPVINDEGDFMKGWWRGLTWRADARYPAMVARAVALHLPLLSSMRYELLSFDNAFLNYRPSFFDQRTLVARFQMNSSLPVHVQMVKKWSYSVMGLLARLGHRLLPHYTSPHLPNLSLISSCRGCDSGDGVVTSAGEPNEVDNRLQFLAQDSQIPVTTPTTSVTATPSLITVSRGDDDDGRDSDAAGTSRGVNDSAGSSDGDGGGSGDGGPAGSSDDGGPGSSDDGGSSGDGGPAGSSDNGGGSGDGGNGSSVNGAGNDDSVGDRGHSDGADGDVGSSWEVTVLLTRSKGTVTNASNSFTVRVTVAIPKRLVGGVLVAAMYRLGWGQKGPYEAWQEVGSPEEPSRQQLKYIRAYEGGNRVGPVGVVVMRPVLQVTLNMTLPDLQLLHLCQPHPATPGQVVGVRTMGVTSSDILVTSSDILVTWTDERITTRCILRYEVERSVRNRGGPYRRVSGKTVTDNNFSGIPSHDSQGRR
ncbi:hypothetical protein Pmani_034764 [Petrolisthes manimaculis]|uniref:Glycosyl hydrolases family 39 N-terminal catalytic domain-containing protein n=1 Tax=Petrolisthes manimaculis TaxID=1843537 RepID=A0AAE1NNP2_9EUCA|nr:hypothetical protein Pmani_034764 [Petrolisthes manimaculis]